MLPKEAHCPQVEQWDQSFKISYSTTMTWSIDNAPSSGMVLCPFDGLFVCCSTFHFAVLCRCGEQLPLIDIPANQARDCLSSHLFNFANHTKRFHTFNQPKKIQEIEKQVNFQHKDENVLCSLSRTWGVPPCTESRRYRGM